MNVFKYGWMSWRHPLNWWGNIKLFFRQFKWAWQTRGRGWEILAWLEEHEAVESFVILDDWDDMGPVRNHLIWTNPSLGLTEEQVQEAIKILLQNS